ncbi:MAG: zinc-ribbon domain-containing protein [Holophagales bacterium]|jgi:uncharacterized membrane protein|nr:zinc-ribbon domain-containing protein [Holophagales bacterium]
MAFCPNCGTSIPDDVKFCPSCGASALGEAKQTQQTTGAQAQPDPNDAEQNKLMAIIAYILFFIPLLTGDHQKSPFVKFHTNQGTVLFLVAITANIAWWILSTILSIILARLHVPFIGCFLSLVGILFPLATLILCVLGIINAANGKTIPLPVIGKWTIIK